MLCFLPLSLSSLCLLYFVFYEIFYPFLSLLKFVQLLLCSVVAFDFWSDRLLVFNLAPHLSWIYQGETLFENLGFCVLIIPKKGNSSCGLAPLHPSSPLSFSVCTNLLIYNEKYKYQVYHSASFVWLVYFFPLGKRKLNAWTQTQGHQLLCDCLNHSSLKQESTFHLGHMLVLGDPSAMLGGAGVMCVLWNLGAFLSQVQRQAVYLAQSLHLNILPLFQSPFISLLSFWCFKWFISALFSFARTFLSLVSFLGHSLSTCRSLYCILLALHFHPWPLVFCFCFPVVERLFIHTENQIIICD